MATFDEVMACAEHCERQLLFGTLFWRCIEDNKWTSAEAMLARKDRLFPDEDVGNLLNIAMRQFGDRPDILLWLIDHGVPVDTRDSTVAGATPLMCAIGSGYLGCAELLLRRGASPNTRVPIDDKGDSLMTAISARNARAVRLLLDHGVTLGNRDRLGQSAEDIARQVGDPQIIRMLTRYRAHRRY